MIKKRILIFSLMFFVLTPFLAGPVFGADPIDSSPNTKKGLEGSVNKLNVIGGAYGENPKTLTEVVGGVIKTVLSLLGVIFLVLTVYGGYKWMLARGESKEVDTAKDIITRAVIGLAIVLAAYAITYFVVVTFSTEAGITTIKE